MGSDFSRGEKKEHQLNSFAAQIIAPRYTEKLARRLGEEGAGAKTGNTGTC